MLRSTDRIRTTHVGSLARPPALLDLMQAAAQGRPADPGELAEAERRAVTDVVARQRAAGLDVVSDGEQTKTGFYAYIGQRLGGFEPRAGGDPLAGFRPEIDSFPEYYEQYLRSAMTGGMAVPVVPLRCTGPVSYIGHERLRRDLDLLRSAAPDLDADQVFVCAVAPSGVGGNEHYPSQADYLSAVADALHVEYAAIVEAGFTLQIDDPFLTDVFSYGTGSAASKLAVAGRYVDAINRSLQDIPRDRVRLHTCYGINEGPRVHDAPLADLIGTLFTIEAGAFSFEAANPRHEHAYHVFETVTLPPDTVLLPGVISHATNIVEHPEVIADRIVRFAERVGRENVVASADCGFSSQATYTPEIHPTIVWAKFEALAEGARRATARLWLSAANWLQGAWPTMVADPDHQEAVMSSAPAIDKFLDAIQTASIPACDVWSADATLDATVPNWRLHAAGADAIRAEYARWFADPGQFGEFRRFGVQADGGPSEIVEYTLSWTENGVPHAAHHMHLLTVRDDRIVADTVMCGGRWPASLLAEMEAADA